MIAGWLLGVPVPLLLMWAPSWGWVVGANLLLGAHDGFTSSTLVVMTIDLVGSARRGIAMGIMAGAGYLGLAASAFVAGLIAARSGLRPEPFFVGLASVVAGLTIAVLLLRETREHARHEAEVGEGSWSVHPGGVSFREAFALVTVRDRAMSACTQSGFVNSLNDAVAWGVFPLLFAARGLDVREISSLAALYAATWGLAQFGTGALSDRVGRKWVIAAGMWVQAGVSRRWPRARPRAPGSSGSSPSGSARRWCIRRSSLPWATRRTRAGAARRSGSSGSGATSDSSPAPSWAACSPTRSACRPRSRSPRR